MSKSECIYDFPLTPDEVRSLASAVSYPLEGDNETAQASDTLRRKATALLAYVEAEARAEEAEALFRETLEADKEKYEVGAF